VLDRRIDPLGVCTIGRAVEVEFCLFRGDEGDSEREGEDVEFERDEGVDIEVEVEGERAARCFLGVPLM